MVIRSADDLQFLQSPPQEGVRDGGPRLRKTLQVFRPNRIVTISQTIAHNAFGSLNLLSRIIAEATKLALETRTDTAPPP